MKLKITFLTCALLLSAVLWGQGYDPQVYNSADVAVVNAIITNNGLKFNTLNDPASWEFAVWDNGTPKKITELKLYSRNLTGNLNVSALTALQNLECFENKLTSLDVSKLTTLQKLSCNSNQLTLLDVSNLTTLQSFNCSNNKLTSLDVSKLTGLTGLGCSGNQLTSLDVSNLTSLQNFNCSNNKLTSLDVSKLTDLRILTCNSNQFTSLDLSGLMALQGVSLQDNQIKKLVIKSSHTLEVSASPSEGGIATFSEYNISKVTVQLTATPNTGYNFKSWTSDSNITFRPSGNTTNNEVSFDLIRKNISITANFDSGSGTETVETNPLKAYSEANGILHITGLRPGQIMHIYNVSGQLVYSNMAMAGEEHIHVSAGLYIIAAGENRVKAVVK